MNKLLPVPANQISAAEALQAVAAAGAEITPDALLAAGLPPETAAVVLAAVRQLWNLTKASRITAKRPTAEQVLAANFARAKIAALLASDAAHLFAIAARVCPVQWAALAHTAGIRDVVRARAEPPKPKPLRTVKRRRVKRVRPIPWIEEFASRHPLGRGGEGR